MRILETSKWTVFLALAFLSIAPSAKCDVITTFSGTHNLLDNTRADLLESWLGEGELAFTNIFTKAPGDDSYDFHAAADGAGRTFSLIEVVDSNGDMLQVIGGYNPQSWTSSGGFNLTPANSDRTAFIFNLTDDMPRVLYQKPVGVDFGAGQYQTYNSPTYGPTFGGGHDIIITSDLSFGVTSSFSYGPAGLFGLADSISRNQNGFKVGQIEVFTFAPSVSETAVVPVPGTVGLGLLGMGLVSGVRRRKKPVQA